MSITKIPKKRFQNRRETFVEILSQNNLENFIVINPLSIYYLTGFSMIPTERPFFLVFKKDEMNFFVPQLERMHISEDIPQATHIETYFEYPDEIHPMIHFKKFMKETLNISNKLGAEGAGARAIWGYQGPSFKDALKIEVPIYPEIIIDMRIIKDEHEIACIKESARWGIFAHKLLQKYTREGENEIDVSFKASNEASKKMRETLGPDYAPVGYSSKPCSAGYRGQIGTYSAIPHALTRNAVFAEGDTLVTGAGGNVAGYLSELERTMFLGEPNERQKGYFSIVLKAQEAAFNEIRPGSSLSQVDRVTRAVFKEAGVMNLVQHHTGHAIGLEAHERPFLDIGLSDIIHPGMVFTVEPGIYNREIGGFRHSDTVVITEEGNEIITSAYPRDLQSLIIDSR